MKYIKQWLYHAISSNIFYKLFRFIYVYHSTNWTFWDKFNGMCFTSVGQILSEISSRKIIYNWVMLVKKLPFILPYLENHNTYRRHSNNISKLINFANSFMDKQLFLQEKWKNLWLKLTFIRLKTSFDVEDDFYWNLAYKLVNMHNEQIFYFKKSHFWRYSKFCGHDNSAKNLSVGELWSNFFIVLCTCL